MIKKILILIFISSQTFAQDTISFTSGQIRAAKVTEVSNDQIKYYRSENLTGAIYIDRLSDIRTIKYSNGHIDSFNVDVQVPVQAPIVTNTVIVSAPKVSNAKTVNKWLRISDQDLYDMIRRFQDPEMQNNLQKKYTEMKMYGERSSLHLALGLLIGFGVVVATAPIVTGLHDSYMLPTSEGMQVAVVGILSGAVIRITGFALSISNKNKKKAKKLEILKMCGEMN